MSTVSKTLAVNAAFLQEIKDDHHEVRELLKSARETASESQPHVDRLSDVLGRLRDQLSLHFALEEAYGYFDAELATSAPWLCEKATKLREEHVDLFVAIGKYVNEAEQLRYHEAPMKKLGLVCKHVVSFCDRIEDHERREVELILEALDDDFGVGD